MADVQESYPTPTTGASVPVAVVLTGAGVSKTASGQYKVTLSLKGTSTVAVTAAAKDSANADPSYTGAFNWVSRNATPTANKDGDVVESYPASTDGKLGEIATVSAATGSPITITGQFVGEALIEVSIPYADVNGANDYKRGAAVAQLVVTVGV